MAQFQHLSRYLALVSLHLNRIFMVLFINVNSQSDQDQGPSPIDLYILKTPIG